MEKKTMGTFLSALRKANGMTQKDLAGKLNVSDKSVSRWENDDGAPDLSLIPVIAEIFGITCDELLRGERKAPEEREPEMTTKGEKQRRYLLKSTLSRYRTQVLAASGISVVGLIAALICNLAFLRGALGFLCGAILLTASVMMELICMNAAFTSVDDAGLEEGELSGFRRTVIRLTERSFGVTVGILGFTLPLLLVSDNAYVGLDVGHMMILGILGAGALLLIYAVVCFFLNASLVRKGTVVLDEKEGKIYHHNHALKRSCAAILSVSLVVTVLGHIAATTIWGPWSIMKGTTFDGYESFVEYMEQDVPDGRIYYGDVAPAPDGAVTYFDENGNEISEEEALTASLKDQSGNEIIYVQRNQNVVSIRYTERDGTLLPITVYTYDDLREAEQKAAVRNVIFGCLYVAEVVAVLAFYFKKRMK